MAAFAALPLRGERPKGDAKIRSVRISTEPVAGA